jgi:hypothetical protein
MPSYDEAAGNLSNTGNAVGNLRNDINQLAPLATTYHSVEAPPAPAPYIPQKTAGQGWLPAFWNKVTSVASQSGNLAEEAGSWIGTQFGHIANDFVGFGQGLGNAAFAEKQSSSLMAQSNTLDNQLNSIMGAYKSGQLDKQGYIKSLNDWSQQNMSLQKQLSDFQSQTSIEQKNMVKSAIGVGVTVASLLVGGAAEGLLGAVGERLGAGFTSGALIDGNLAAAATLSKSAGLVQAANIIEHLASSEADWASLSPLAQNAMRVATTEVMGVASGVATGGQITRAVAADLLLKFPLYYNAMSGTGNQVYDELNQNKYGDAVKTIGFNAALLFSGGPIGWGLKQAKGLFSDAVVAMGLRPGSILDELSSRVGNGDRLALGKIAQDQIRQGNTADVKAMIVGLESNLRAEKGNAASAVNRITDHLSNYVGWGDLKNMTHQEMWDNMVSYWKHSVGLQDLKAQGKIEGMAADDTRTVVPGRFSTRDKNGIATAVTKGDLSLSTGNLEAGNQTVQDRLQAWEKYKAANPNAAFANNVNVDKQIQHLITTIQDPQELHTAINNIATQFGLSGIPADYAAKMAKDGYIAIVPTSHNLPLASFEQTSGKLATNSVSEGSNFFTKAAQPVPVLQSIGTMLTKMGLSPEVAQQRVQDVFTQKFTAAAGEFGFLHLQGDTAAQTGQDTLSKLYDYMKNPTGGIKVFGHYLPITDMRQMTTGDIQRALGVNKQEAQKVGDAIMQAYLDVPASVAGLGNKIMDANFKINPTAGIYTRIQSAGHFTWNPVFTQARLPYKLEMLAQMQTGGKFPTIAGTNRFMSMFFPDQYKALNDIIDNPDFRNLVGGGMGGEADAAATGAFADRGANSPPKTSLLPIAGLVKSMADNAGLDTATFMQQFPNAVSDATHALLHYDRNNSFLNSPLARTLNMAFFPFRFNVKVSSYMANFLAKQPPAIQYAAVKGVMNAQTFLKSPQGQAWYAQHSDAITLFKYLSPLETIGTISAVLTHPGNISSYGELGGLPFGWIPQMTDAVGLTHFAQAYVNPKTGVIAKDYVPTSMYGAMNTALQDLLGSLFSYPGAEIGLPSKGSIMRGLTSGLPGAKDTQAVNNPNLTPQDLQFSQIARQANGGGSAPAPQSPQQSSQSTQVPAQKSPLETPLPKKVGGGKLKKGQFKPALLPGQSQYGQL